MLKDRVEKIHDTNLEKVCEDIKKIDETIKWTQLIKCSSSNEFINCELDNLMNNLLVSSKYLYEIEKNEYVEYLEAQVVLAISKLEQVKIEIQLSNTLLPKLNEIILSNKILFSDGLFKKLLSIDESLNSIFSSYKFINNSDSKFVNKVKEELETELDELIVDLETVKDDLDKQIKDLLGDVN
ncbi:hypothetical protein [uncultured Intestinibacter sp.]|uniref:hypothetical protein n=1 Tax=uncultured Intestinibacter sp. TaxID=1505659 RepID=UPI0027DB107D|nr:hypothetical protein [uncultured Intestinibacter sp.]